MVSVAESRTHGVRRRRRDTGKGIVELGLKRAARVVASALGEPQGIVERTRWLFAMLAVTVLELVVLPAAVFGGGPLGAVASPPPQSCGRPGCSGTAAVARRS